MTFATVPLVPPPNGAEWITSLSTLLMVSGVVLVMCALPPVRRVAADLVDRLEAMFFPPKKVAVAPVTAEPAAAPENAPQARREIDDFDLSLFED